ncbi:MAG: ankyrin repeat domain-containing protein [Candidatus Obscuribacterales bacterium]|nr:ankyrin repeat domain-containing protein [Candidatus Obscuribacterales bacterium]
MLKTQFLIERPKIVCLLASIAIWSLSVPLADAQKVTYVKPAGVYATIHTSNDIKLMQVLANGSPAEKARNIKLVLQSPTKFSPGVLFALSAALSEHGDKDDAMFWFLVAELRAQYDAQRCADDSARPGALVLRRQFGESIYPYMRQNADKVESAIPKVLAWDTAHSYDYDYRWINLHGLQAFGATSKTSQPELTLPKSEWPAIRSKVRADFKEEYTNTVALIRGKSIKASKPQANSADRDLTMGCFKGDLAAVQDALKRGANPKPVEPGQTPLHLAATAGSLPICKLLVSKGADVNASSQGSTPLLCAARYCHPDVIEFLLKSKANPKVRNSDGMTPILTLLNDFKRSDAAFLKIKSTSSDKDAMAAIKMLIAAGVDPNVGATFFGTPLKLAAGKPGCVEIVRVLLDGGAKVNESDNDFTALHSAVFAGDFEIVKLLVSHGADVNARNSMKQTPLARAKKQNAVQIEKYLIEHGARE